MFRSTTDRSHLVAKLISKLDSEMAEAADAFHRNKIAGRRAAVSQSIKRGDSRAQQRACFGITECVWYRRQCVDGSDHVFLISPVVADTCDFGVTTIEEASTPTFDTRVVSPAIPADANTLSLLPSGDLCAKFIDHAR